MQLVKEWLLALISRWLLFLFLFFPFHKEMVDLEETGC